MTSKIPDAVLKMCDAMEETFELEDFAMLIEADPVSAQIEDSLESTISSACWNKIIAENMDGLLDNGSANTPQLQQLSEMEVETASNSNLDTTSVDPAPSLDELFQRVGKVLDPLLLAYIDHHTVCSAVNAEPEKMRMILEEAESLLPFTCGICRTWNEQESDELEPKPREEPPNSSTEKICISVDDLINQSSESEVLEPKERNETITFFVHLEDDLSEQHVLKQQPQSKSKKLHSCPQCTKPFIKESLVRVHVETVHEKTKKHACSFCGKYFARISYMRHHEKIQHMTKADQICLTCGKAYKQKSQLIVHQRIHNGTQPFQCSICDTKFNTKKYLQQHIQAHGNERPFDCPLCTKTYKHSRTLHYHQRLKHPKVET